MWNRRLGVGVVLCGVLLAPVGATAPAARRQATGAQQTPRSPEKGRRMYYGLTGKMIAVEGKRDELAAILLDAAKELRKNADCLVYIVSVSETEPNAIWVSEVWKSKQAHADSLKPASTREMIARARPLIAGFGERFETQPLGGKGLPR